MKSHLAFETRRAICDFFFSFVFFAFLSLVLGILVLGSLIS